MPVSPDTISSTQKALCLYLLYLGTIQILRNNFDPEGEGNSSKSQNRNILF